MTTGKGIYAQVGDRKLLCGSEKFLGENHIAVDAADVALMSDDISKIPYLKRLSNATVKTIKASITLSMCIILYDRKFE